MTNAQPFLLILVLIALFTSVASGAESFNSITPDTISPGEDIIIQVEVDDNATNVTLAYSICTESSCGTFNYAAMMEENGTYQAVLEPLDNGMKVTYQVLATIDGVEETSEQWELYVSASETVTSRNLEIYAGLLIGGAIVTIGLAFAIKNKRSENDDEE